MEMTKKLKNKKGFTLIELIVVIAILAILALIAIPRFAGFTDKAKIGNDKQYASIVGNSLVVMLAANDFKAEDTATENTFTITGSTGKVTNTGIVGFSGSDLTNQAKLEKLVLDKKLQYFDTMTVTINAEGEHWISQTTKTGVGTVNYDADGNVTT